MANFDESFEEVMDIEGGYNNDPTDFGKETYMGISRRFHPNWEGWRVIDHSKREDTFPANLLSNSVLQGYVRDFYKQYYWDVYLGDELPSQIIANEMFDIAVNMGVDRAVRYLQRAMNLLNRNGKGFADIAEDGKFGGITLSTMIIACQGNESLIFKIMNILQGAHYIETMSKTPSQEKYARGWFRRVTISRET